MEYADPIINTTSPTDLFVAINDATEGMLGVMLVMAIFFIFLMATSTFGMKRAFATSALITFVLSIFLVAMGIVTQGTMFVVIVLAGIGILLLAKGE